MPPRDKTGLFIDPADYEVQSGMALRDTMLPSVPGAEQPGWFPSRNIIRPEEGGATSSLAQGGGEDLFSGTPGFRELVEKAQQNPDQLTNEERKIIEKAIELQIIPDIFAQAQEEAKDKKIGALDQFIQDQMEVFAANAHKPYLEQYAASLGHFMEGIDAMASRSAETKLGASELVQEHYTKLGIMPIPEDAESWGINKEGEIKRGKMSDVQRMSLNFLYGAVRLAPELTAAFIDNPYELMKGFATFVPETVALVGRAANIKLTVTGPEIGVYTSDQVEDAIEEIKQNPLGVLLAGMMTVGVGARTAKHLGRGKPDKYITQRTEVVEKQQARIDQAESEAAKVKTELEAIKKEKAVPAVEKPAPKPTEVAKAAKEPWEMTRKAFADSDIAKIEGFSPPREGWGGTIQGSVRIKSGQEGIGTTLEAARLDAVNKEHLRQIKKALYKDKSVSAEVLKDYPDLVKKAVPKRVAKPTKVAKPTVAKEPWEMTREEYWIRRESTDTAAARDRIGLSDRKGFVRELESFRQARYGEHRSYIERALREGKSVSAEVLKLYPDLAKKVPAKVEAIAKLEKAPPIPKELEPAKGKAIAPADVANYLSKSLKIPIRVGKYRQKARGIYKQQPEVVRLKDPSDIAAISHEVAHHIDKVFDLSKIRKGDRELTKLDYDPLKGRSKEGFAEYVRMWLTESDNVAQLAPKFTKKFNEFLDKNPELKGTLENTRGLIRRWREQGAEERVYAQIDMQGRGTPGPIMEKAGRGLRRIGTLFVDDLIPLEYAERQMRGVKTLDPRKIDPATSPTMIARVEVRKAPAKTHDMILGGTFDWAGKYTGISLRDALAPVSKQIKEFTTYAYARRGLELHGRGINPGIDLADAQYVVSKLKSSKFDRAFDEVVRFQDRVLQYAVDAGVLSKEAAATVRDLNQAYIPLKRVFEEGSGFGYGGGKKIADLPKPLKLIRGSGRQILNPWHSIIQSTSEIIAIADKVRIGNALVELSKKTEGAGKWVEKVEPPKRAISQALKDLEKQLKDAGVDLSQADMDAVVTLYANSPKYLGKENIVAFWREGKREFYQLEPDLYRAIMNSDRMAMPWIVNQIMGAPARAVRLGATGLQAGFSWITNPIRDAQAFALQTEFSTGLPHEVAKGLYRRVKPGDPYTRIWKRSGGDFSIHIGFDRRYLKSAQQRVLASDILRKTYNVARHPIEIAREALSFSEAAPRIAELEAAYKKGEKLYGKESVSARLMGAGAAAEVTINFGRMGAYGKYINQIIPFWNAGIQGWSKMYRFGKEHPVKAGIRATAFISAPTFGLWWMHKDEQWYQDLPAWRKYGFWNFHIGQNKDGSNRILSLPRPFDWGIVFGSVPEMMLNYWYEKDKKAMTDALTAIGEWAVPDYIPASMRPIIEWSANYDFFRDRATDPYYEVRYKDPEYRYSEYTPETAKWLGKQLGLSPRKINHLVSSATGGLGEDIIRGSETFKQFFEEGMMEIEHPADIPIAGRLFHREPPPDKKMEWLFFQAKDERQKIITMMKEGDVDKAIKRLNEWNRTHPAAQIQMTPKR